VENPRLEEKEVMLRGGEVDIAREVIEQFGALLGEPGEHAQGSLLQILMRVEGGKNHRFFVIEDAGALIFSAPGFFLQLEELVENLAFGGVESAAERAVETG
jgi:signal transduction histidine kinase